ncbi:MAG: TonB-dependent receptor [Acidobacteria bacterium]|nr:TonB-dependent receptor [Acidobacteriota bacterium]
MKTKSFFQRRLLIALCFVPSGVASFCQAPGTGAIRGVVLDAAGIPLRNAEVTVTNESTRVLRETATSDEGTFVVALLQPGSYAVEGVAPGFAKKILNRVQVAVTETVSLHIVLPIAGVETAIQVDANTSLVQTESSNLGGSVNHAAVEALPLANRNYTQILGLSPGIVVELPNAAELGRGTQNVAANGAKTVSNNVLFNGIDANNLAQNSMANDGNEIGTAIPAPDAIEEFKVQTANYDAEYGRGSGANIDLVSKTGTNKFHGSAWEFLRNDIFNANDFFLKQGGQKRPTLKQNQFGGSLGGPIRRDRTFFFLAYQGLTSANSLGGKVTALLPQLTGDRSAATLGRQFCPANHLAPDGTPATGYLTHAGGTQVACDGSNINPVALAILNLKLASGEFAIPSPQTAVALSDASQLPVGQSTFALPATYKENQFSANLDHTLDAKDTLSARFFYSRAPTQQPFSPNAANVPGWGTDSQDRNTMFVLSETHTFSGNLVNVARAGYMRFDGISTVRKPIFANDVGIGTPTGAAAKDSPIPGITVDGLFTIGDAGTPGQWQVTNAFIWQDMVSWVRRRHNMRFGAEYKYNQVDLDAPFSKDGLLDIRTFADFLVGQSASQNGSPIGSSNVTQSTGGSGISRKDTRYKDFAAFVQDDYKVLPRLTLNIGLRYEIFGSPFETNGRLPNFDPGIAIGSVPPSGSLSGFVVPANFQGTVPQGVTRLTSRGLWPTRHGDISPRVGFAWQMASKPVVVLRGGYGVYYDRHSNGYVESTQGQAPFSTQQIQSDSANAGATLASPFAPLLPSPSSYPIFSPRVPFGFPFVEGIAPGTVDGYTQQYNVNAQYAFATDYLLELGYVGTRSTHRPGSIEFNQALLASPSHPINGETTNSTNNLIQRLPYQGISPGSLFTKSEFIANYNSLQTSLVRRLRQGLQFRGSYTWSKSLDQTSGSGGSGLFELWLLTNDQNNPRQAYGLTDFDRTHRGVLSFTWQSPKLSTMPAVARDVLSNWSFSGIGVIQSGSPITVMDGNAGSVYGNFENRAQRTGSSPATAGSLFQRVNGLYLDPSAFTRAPEAPNGTSLADQDFGNGCVGIVRGPAQRNIDAAVERIFPITENQSFRFRAEFFNLTNTPQFANPSNFLGYGDPTDPNPVASPSFGKITGTVTNPRVIQLAARYSF